jgi:hypothetical protein
MNLGPGIHPVQMSRGPRRAFVSAPGPGGIRQVVCAN